MQGKVPASKSLFDPKIAKIERKNRKKKKQTTTKPPGESFSIDSPSIEKPLVIENINDRDGGGNNKKYEIIYKKLK